MLCPQIILSSLLESVVPGAVSEILQIVMKIAELENLGGWDLLTGSFLSIPIGFNWLSKFVCESNRFL